MNRWRPLTDEEAHLLKTYYAIKNKIVFIFLCVFQIMSVLMCVLSFKDFFSETDKSLVAILLVLALLIFIVLPEIFKKKSKRPERSIESKHAMLYQTVVINKYAKTQKSSEHTGVDKKMLYYIEVQAEINRKNTLCKIITDCVTYTEIKPNDICNLVFFPLRKNEKFRIKYMDIFDNNYTVAKKYSELYSKFKK
jgi:hypothetical protein